MNIFEHWDAIESDLLEVYGIDLEDPVLCRERSWAWLMDRINGLIDRPPTIYQHRTSKSIKPVKIPSTRVGFLLNPPDFSD